MKIAKKLHPCECLLGHRTLAQKQKCQEQMKKEGVTTMKGSVFKTK